MSVYDYKVKTREGNEESLKDYKDKVLLIVNTATECGFTPQYEDLQEIYDELGGEDFEILDFPCDQFGHQAPGSSDEIHNFCTARFGVTFPQFEKIDVNGENAAPLFEYLQNAAPFEGLGKSPQGLALAAMLKVKDSDYKKKNDIKWNFTKFLINKDGEVVERFEPTASMKKVKEAIKEELDK